MIKIQKTAISVFITIVLILGVRFFIIEKKDQRVENQSTNDSEKPWYCNTESGFYECDLNEEEKAKREIERLKKTKQEELAEQEREIREYQEKVETSFQELVMRLKGKEVFIEEESILGENLLQKIDFSNSPKFGTVTSSYLTYDGDCVEVSKEIKNLTRGYLERDNNNSKMCNNFSQDPSYEHYSILRENENIFIFMSGYEWFGVYLLDEKNKIFVDISDRNFYKDDNFIISGGSDYEYDAHGGFSGIQSVKSINNIIYYYTDNYSGYYISSLYKNKNNYFLKLMSDRNYKYDDVQKNRYIEINPSTLFTTE